MEDPKTTFLGFIGFFVLLAVNLLGIIGDFWWCEKATSFDTKMTRVGLWNFCEDTCCASLADKMLVNDSLTTVRFFVSLGSFLIWVAFLFGILTDISLAKAIIAITGSCLIFLGLLLWRYQYVGKVLENNSKANVNGACFYLTLSVGFFGLFFGLLHLYVYNSKRKAVIESTLDILSNIPLTEEQQKQIMKLPGAPVLPPKPIVAPRGSPRVAPRGSPRVAPALPPRPIARQKTPIVAPRGSPPKPRLKTEEIAKLKELLNRPPPRPQRPNDALIDQRIKDLL
jgi:hypothetical protein